MTHTLISPPIVVTESGDADVFESVEAAERYLEPYDVNDLLAYDSTGRLLRLLPTTPRITIEAAELVPTHEQNALEVLLKFLNEVGVSPQTLKDQSLQGLFSIALNYKTK